MKLLTPRWLFGHLLALSLIGLFISFGFWQLRRLGQRDTANALLESRLSAEPQPFAALATQYDLNAPADAENAAAYRRTAVTGRFDAENEVLLRSRAYSGNPGYHVLTPLQLQDGRALLVDRGWVPFELDDPPIAEAAPPPGTVTVTGILQPSQVQPEGGGLADRLGLVQGDPAEGPLEAVFFVNPARLEPQMPYALEPIFLELAAQTPAQSGQLPIPPPPLELTRGPHLSYAFQWFAFALIGVVGYGVLMRGVLRDKPEQPELDDSLRGASPE